MEDDHYRIVFKGEIGFDFDQEEVKDNLQNFCGFNQSTVERLFSGGSYVLKKDIDEPTAARYVDALQKLGALAEMVPMVPRPRSGMRPQSTPESVPRPNSAGQFKCPACNHPQEQGLTCVACGIYFSKYDAGRQRQALARPGEPPGRIDDGRVQPSPGLAGSPAGCSATRGYLVNCLALVLPLVAFQVVLGEHLMFLGFILLPTVFLFYILYQVVARDQDLATGLVEHVALEWDRSARDDWQEAGFPRVTYGMVLANLLLYYGLAIHLKPATLSNHFAFLPATPNVWNVPLSAVASLFLHAGGWQLWGSLIFLWIFGSAVEKRLGGLRLLIVYLLSGIAAGEFAVLAHSLLLGAPLHVVGSSGAIAGLIGIFAVCCRNRNLVFPVPLLGAISLVYPFRITVRINALAVIGLFFFCCLAGVPNPLPGSAAALVAHLVNAGGMLTGVLIGLFLDPEKLRSDDSSCAGQVERTRHSCSIR